MTSFLSTSDSSVADCNKVMDLDAKKLSALTGILRKHQPDITSQNTDVEVAKQLLSCATDGELVAKGQKLLARVGGEMERAWPDIPRSVMVRTPHIPNTLVSLWNKVRALMLPSPVTFVGETVDIRNITPLHASKKDKRLLKNTIELLRKTVENAELHTSEQKIVDTESSILEHTTPESSILEHTTPESSILEHTTLGSGSTNMNDSSLDNKPSRLSILPATTALATPPTDSADMGCQPATDFYLRKALWSKVMHYEITNGEFDTRLREKKHTKLPARVSRYRGGLVDISDVYLYIYKCKMFEDDL